MGVVSDGDSRQVLMQVFNLSFLFFYCIDLMQSAQSQFLEQSHSSRRLLIWQSWKKFSRSNLRATALKVNSGSSCINLTVKLFIMDIVKLHHIAEQRCKQLGCKMTFCQREAQDPNQCQQFHRELLACIKVEKDYLIERYQRTGKFI